MFRKEGESIKGIYRHEHTWLRSDTANAKDCEHGKPQQHQRSEQAPDSTGPTTLQGEEPQQRDDREREYGTSEGRGGDADSLQGTQYRHCRCDYAVAVKKRAPDEAECPDCSPGAQQRLLVE